MENIAFKPMPRELQTQVRNDAYKDIESMFRADDRKNRAQARKGVTDRIELGVAIPAGVQSYTTLQENDAIATYIDVLAAEKNKLKKKLETISKLLVSGASAPGLKSTAELCASAEEAGERAYHIIGQIEAYKAYLKIRSSHVRQPTRSGFPGAGPSR